VRGRTQYERCRRRRILTRAGRTRRRNRLRIVSGVACSGDRRATKPSVVFSHPVRRAAGYPQVSKTNTMRDPVRLVFRHVCSARALKTIGIRPSDLLPRSHITHEPVSIRRDVEFTEFTDYACFVLIVVYTGTRRY